MFDHCQTFRELNDAYEMATAAVRSSCSMEQVIAALAAGRATADDRIPQWDAIRAAMHARWSELSGEPWPGSDNA